MSLEAALVENTAAIKQLITVMQSAPCVADKPVSTKKTTAPAAAPTAAPVTAPAATSALNGSTNDAVGNPIGTQYFDVPAHNTVYAVKPGEAAPNVAGALPIADSQYLLKKAEYQGKVNAAVAAPAASAPAPTAAPATGAPSATPQADTVSAAQPQADVAFPAVVAKLQELHKLGGNDALKRVLDKHGVGKVPELNGKASNATLIADTDAVIKEVNDAKALGL